jgi:hypothetical protein
LGKTTEKLNTEQNEKPITESVEKPTIAAPKKRTSETVKKILNGKEHTCTYTYNTKADKTCEEALQEIFVKYLKENNIELTD